MRLSVSIAPDSWKRGKELHERLQGITEQIRFADAAGIDTVWASEDPDGWDVMAVLAAIAVQTERIRLATSVVNPFFRHPSLIAASISTLDQLSGGRARLGLGRGQTEWYGTALGMDVSAPLTRLEETISLLRQWWSSGLQATAGGPYRVQGWHRTFGPVQTQPPIYLAAAGPRAVGLAARNADGIIFNDLASLDAIRAIINAARNAARLAGRAPDELEFIARPRIVVTDDPEPEYEQVKNVIAMIYTLPGMARLIAVDGFDVEAILGPVREVMHTNRILEQGGAFVDLRAGGDLQSARKLIPNEFVAKLALIGTESELRVRLREYATAGVSEICWRLPDLAKSSDWKTALDLVRK